MMTMTTAVSLWTLSTAFVTCRPACRRDEMLSTTMAMMTLLYDLLSSSLWAEEVLPPSIVNVTNTYGKWLNTKNFSRKMVHNRSINHQLEP